MEWLTDPQAWVSLLTLTVLEVVLGIDNVIFISILAGKLPESQRDRARKLGLMAALVTRVLLLLSITFLARLTNPLFTLPLIDHAVSGRDLVLLIGGLFLMFKSVREIHEKLEGDEGLATAKVPATFTGVIVQIMILDVVFSLDSVITAVGMAQHIPIMIAAVLIAVAIMMVFSGPVSAFVEKHPTVKMLALSFLLLIGVNLVAEGMGQHIPKGYVYFAMAFSVLVEMLNLRVKAKSKPVHLREPYAEKES